MHTIRFALAVTLTAASLGAVSPADAGKPRPVKHGYVVNKIVVPTNNTQAREVGADLNRDGDIDNQYGQLTATMVTQGVDVQGAADALLETGDLVRLVSVRTTSLRNANDVKVRLFTGIPKAAPDLDGGGLFSVDKNVPHADLKAKIVNKVIKAKRGAVPVALPSFLPWTPPVQVVLNKATIKAKCTAKKCTQGTITGALTVADIEALLIPSLGTATRAVIARDCSGTTEDTCMDPSDGRTAMALFDTDNDGTVTDQEIGENSLIMSLLAPDIDLSGDGEPDALSVGLGFGAVNAKVRGD